MKTLFTYIPVLGCSAMMVVCLIAMCGSRLWRRTPAEQTNVAPDPAAGAQPNSPNAVPADVLAELAALRGEVAELRRSARPAPDETQSRAANG